MKKLILKIQLLIMSVIKRPFYFINFLRNIRNEDILDNDKHIELAANWLLKAQSNGNDNGYSRGFYLYKNGWDKSYIETTGYIIPTLLNVTKYLCNDRYKTSALKAGEWLLTVQKPNGSFTDIDGNQELVFDTGQVLYGLIAIYEINDLNIELKQKYRNAIYKASNWLCSVQDEDGSWTRYGYRGISHSYYSRVSSILYKSGTILQEKKFHEFASRHIKWVLSCQNKNGFFNKLKFSPGEDNLLHAIIYVLEGLYDYYIYTQDKNVLNALLINTNKLKGINTNRDLILYSLYDKSYNNINEEKCITGLAQWANLSFKMYQLTNDEEYLLCARKTNHYLKAKQFKNENDLKGSLPGSVPFWGVYAPYSAINWGVKFFLDSLIESSKFPISIIEESNLWTSECFKFNKKVVDEKFTLTSQDYIKVLTPYMKRSKNILDLGCGEGKYIRYFKNILIDKNIKGIDPCFYNGTEIEKGDAYNINFEENFDLIYSIEALQHVKYLDIALKHINNKLSNNGYFIICDRNPKSFSGYLKPVKEYLGKWMYPYDSPFTEKWYSLNQWKGILSKNYLTIENIKTFYSKQNKKNRYSIIVTRKTK